MMLAMHVNLGEHHLTRSIFFSLLTLLFSESQPNLEHRNSADSQGMLTWDVSFLFSKIFFFKKLSFTGNDPMLETVLRTLRSIDLIRGVVLGHGG